MAIMPNQLIVSDGFSKYHFITTRSSKESTYHERAYEGKRQIDERSGMKAQLNLSISGTSERPKNSDVFDFL